MSKIITSDSVVFLDNTDNRKLDVYITSSLPTVQIKNVNTGKYTPNWASTPLVLDAKAYLDSEDVTSKTTFLWYKKTANGVETPINTTANTQIIINNNDDLDNNQLIVYICKAIYKASDADSGVEDVEQITFSQTTTGLNGTDGSPAPAVQAQYSVNGTSGWTAILNAATHKYIRYSYDGGTTWTTAIKMVGEDGTSVRVKGTATSKNPVSGTSYFELVYNGTTITGDSLGDSYILETDGHLYVCVDSRNGNDYFMDVGQIKGPQGNDGVSEYVYIKYATKANPSNSEMLETPNSTTTHIGICVSAEINAPTTASSYTWSKFVGDNAKSIVLSGDSQVFKVDKKQAYAPSTIKVTAQRINIPTSTVLTWYYNGSTEIPSGVSKNGDVITITGKSLTTNSLVVKVSDGTVEDVFTVYKAFDGADGNPGDPGSPASLAFLTNENISFSANANGQVTLTSFTTNVVAYNGTTKVTPTIGTISGLPSGMTVSAPVTSSNEQILTFSIANNSNLGSASSNNGTITIPVTSPVSTNLILSWSKINTGATGVGIRSIQVKYGTTQFTSKPPENEDDWKDDVLQVEVPEGHYLWTRTLIDYTDDNKDDTVTYTYVKQGVNGEKGDTGTSVGVTEVRYTAHNSAYTPPSKPIDEWSTAVEATSVTLPYLWTRTIFSDGKYADSVARYGTDGAKGDPAKSIVLSANSQIFKVSKSNIIAPSTITVVAQASNTSITSWSYSINGGQTFVNTAPNGVLRNGNAITVTGSTLSTDSLVIKASDGTINDAFTIYKTYDGTDGIPGNPGSPAPIAFLTNENITFSANTQGQIASTTITSNVVAYNGTVKVLPTVGTITGMPTGMTITKSTIAESNEVGLTITIANNSTLGSAANNMGTISVPITSPINTVLSLTWSKVNTGATGNTGRGITKVTEYYLATSVSSGVTRATSGWKDTIQTVTDTNKYLWNYEVISYTDGTTVPTDPIIIGVYGDKGNTGNGIASIEEWYLATSASSGVTTATTGWKNALQPLTATNKYLWNYEIITYTNGNKVPTTPVIIGVYGDKGDKGNDAYTVLLTNESHVFAGSISAAIASSATTQVLAYNGATSQSVTIVSVNGVAASTDSTATGISGLSFQCSALSGTSPTITFACTTSFVSPNGTIPIVIKVGSISITKMFTYSIAFKGATGGQGNQGNPGSPATAYWLVSSASVVQKASTGTVALTPSTLTFTGKSKTGTNVPTDYGCRWKISTSTDGSTFTDTYTSTANEASKSFNVELTYRAIKVQMYLAGGTSTLLDEQIIPVVTDGAIGEPGKDAVTFQIYSINGYALSKNTPTITLQTFAYIGGAEITEGATYAWYSYGDAGWDIISGASNPSLVVTRENVSFSKSYMCKMTFSGVEYTSVATVDDKSDANKVFTTKPSNYTAGDIWIVGSDYKPSGVEIGTLLRASYTNKTYADTDWITAMKYDKQIGELKESLDTYNQYFSFDSTDGLKISAKDTNGTPSKFSTSLTNERLSFNYGNESIAYINGTKMNIKEAEIESPLTVTGKYSGSTMLQAPIINIGNFSIVVESNGSLSIVANV